jgi:hypothetical protein
MNDLLMLFFIIALAICALVAIFLGGAYVMAKRCAEVLQGWHTGSAPTAITCNYPRCNCPFDMDHRELCLRGRPRKTGAPK